jgi:hypothetical protein
MDGNSHGCNRDSVKAVVFNAGLRYERHTTDRVDTAVVAVADGAGMLLLCVMVFIARFAVLE